MSAKSDVINHLNLAKSLVDQGIEMISSGSKDRDVIQVAREAQRIIQKTNKLILEYHIKVCLRKLLKPGNTKEICREIETVYKYSQIP
ncbi:hypothetical protein A2Z33_06200 [Candidatus Gottesmanbacteria bacterium RBG_16_52_11]|uniref:Uncharacterized protein n=1 Tax=Candidatus Gottesmanbacteria bacterium RBG_16_52_11 TaxID=1798374 RepID=A0A1F5YXK4_9BACT|nr:MAG: hypothetical protein A2Z33_06200 [Candidatus Gottesmanbacteria bacterium RBG_16_52_11]